MLEVEEWRRKHGVQFEPAKYVLHSTLHPILTISVFGWTGWIVRLDRLIIWLDGLDGLDGLDP